MLKRKITRLFLLLSLCCFCSVAAFAQPPRSFCGCFKKFVKFQDKIYAHDGEGIYYSEDLGKTWQHTSISETIIDLAANDGMLMYISYWEEVDTSPALPIAYTYHGLYISTDGMQFEQKKLLTGASSLNETTSYSYEDLVLLNDSTVYWFYAWHSARGATTERQGSFLTDFGNKETFRKNHFQNDYAFANELYVRPDVGATNYTQNGDFTGYSFYPILGAPNEYPEAFFSYENKFHTWFSNGQLFRTDTIQVWDLVPNVDLKGAFVSDGTVYKKTDDGIFKALNDDFSDWKKVYGNQFNTSNSDVEPTIGFFDEVFLISNENCENYRSFDEGVSWNTHPGTETFIDLLISRGDIVFGIPIFSDTTFVENLQSQFGCDSTIITIIQVSTTEVENFSPKNLKFTIYPNPHSQEAHLSFITKKHLQANIQLFDALGNHIFSDEFYHQENSSNYSIFEKNPHLPKGIYFLKIETEGQFFVEKILRN